MCIRDRLYIVLLFILKNPISYVVFTIYTITLILISGVPFKMILKGLKPMLWIFIFTAVLNVFMTPGDTVWALKIFKFTLKITKEGIESGSLMVIRLLYLVMGTSLLTLTTSPLQLTDGIEKLLKPFNKIKVPSHEIAMMMTIATVSYTHLEITDGKESIEPLYDRIVGRTAMQDVIHPETGEVLAKNGELITDVQANNIVNAGIEKVYLRSVLTCKSKIGVCAKCYGTTLATGELVMSVRQLVLLPPSQ